jgi:hypothetical protein
MREADIIIKRLAEDYSIPISGVTDFNRSEFKCGVQQKYCISPATVASRCQTLRELLVGDHEETHTIIAQPIN